MRTNKELIISIFYVNLYDISNEEPSLKHVLSSKGTIHDASLQEKPLVSPNIYIPIIPHYPSQATFYELLTGQISTM